MTHSFRLSESFNASSRRARRPERSRTAPRIGRVDELESRILLSRTFVETEPNDSPATAQIVAHVPGVGVVDSVTPSGGPLASITAGNSDFFQFNPAVDGRLVISATHRGGGGGGATDNLRVRLLDSAGNPIAGQPEFNLDSNGTTVTITEDAVLSATTYLVRVVGEDAVDFANYQLRIRTVDRFDDFVSGNNANNRRSDATAGSESNLGTLGPAGIAAADFTIVGTDKDYFRFMTGGTVATVNITLTMPPGTGPRSGGGGPTNLGLHVRNASGAVIAASNDTGDKEEATLINAPANTLFFIDVYGNGPTQVNQYDLLIETPSPSGTIQGQKFDDLNGDGIHDENEPGLNGWTIFLETDGDCVQQGGELTAVTGDVDLDGDLSIDMFEEQGIYEFTGLADGSYFVCEDIQPGWVQTFPADEDPDQPFRHEVIVSDALSVDGLDFGNFLTFTISGRKFDDLDGDGTDNGGSDPGVGGVIIFLDLNDDGRLSNTVTDDTCDGNELEPCRITDGAGAYSFTGLGPNADGYIVREIGLPGTTPTAPPGDFYTIPAISGGNVTNADFGNFTNISISGRKYDDTNGDGDDEGGAEPGVGGVTIFLDLDGSGDLSGPDMATTTSTTTPIGSYSFPNLGPRAGGYDVYEDTPAGTTETQPGGFYNVSATSGVDATGVDFGNFTNFTISGRKFDDLDNSGDDNGGMDPGLGGVIIYLDLNDNGMLDNSVMNDTCDGNELEPCTTTSATDGTYSFIGVGPNPAGYILREVEPLSSNQTFPSTGFYSVPATSGVDQHDLDFGNFRVVVGGMISGQKFTDFLGNGISPLASDDTPLGGFTIELFQDDGDGIFEPTAATNPPTFDTLFATRVTTAGSGAYTFNGLPDGTYFVREQRRPGYIQTGGQAFYSFTVSGAVASPSTSADFGNTNCRDFAAQTSGPDYTVTALRSAALTFELIGFSTGATVQVLDANPDPTMRMPVTVYAFNGSPTDFIQFADGMLRPSQLTDPEARLRADLRNTTAGTNYNLRVTGTGTLRVTNQVNIATGATLALQIEGERCDDLIAVRSTSAKRVFVGTVNARPLTPAAVGTQYNDVVLDALLGTPTISRIEINAGAGNDVVRIRPEILVQSTVSGGAGDDTIRAGDGKGTINAQAGADRVLGGLADDVLNGGSEDDQLFGLDGADRADGGDHNDLIGGGNGDDPLLRGGNGNDIIAGGAGRDRLIGDGGTDTIYRDVSPADTQVSGEILRLESDPGNPGNTADPTSAVSILLAEWDNDADPNNTSGAIDTWDELINSLLP